MLRGVFNMNTQCNNCGHTIPDDSEYCTVCNKHRNIKDYKAPVRNKFIGIIGLIIIAVLFFWGYNKFIELPKTKEFKDYTNKEMQQFLDWKEKEDQKKQDNEKFFK